MITASKATNPPSPSASSLRIGSRPESVRLARDFAARWFAAQGYDPERVADARLVASELVTNAHLHAAGSAEIVLRCCLCDVGAVLEVEDAGEARPVPAGNDAYATSGRGLFLVESLAAAWGTTLLADGGKAVYAVFPAP
ncbi:ATP-binding protein [Actinomadura atramentaria]|uniref:ATP-binding protein n=1 Tax=Actinomadura atramentaria TaxID=1990 RepID=UPI00036F4D1E|nr:ATP-binding protein [Actinomadura atramentaria]